MNFHSSSEKFLHLIICKRAIVLEIGVNELPWALPAAIDPGAHILGTCGGEGVTPLPMPEVVAPLALEDIAIGIRVRSMTISHIIHPIP